MSNGHARAPGGCHLGTWRCRHLAILRSSSVSKNRVTIAILTDVSHEMCCSIVTQLDVEVGVCLQSDAALRPVANSDFRN